MKPTTFANAEPLDLADIDEAMLREVLSAFLPPAVLPTADWIEGNVVLPSESNAEPGPVRLAPYQRQILEAFDDPRCETIVAMMASQTGKSLTLDGIILAETVQHPGPILLVHPTTSKAVAYVKDRLNPLIASTPAVADKLTDDTNSSKRFEGGSLNVGSSHVPEDLAMRSVRLLVMDEIDRFARSAGNEGDPLGMAIKRLRTFRNSKMAISSTPTMKGASRIASWFDRGTQERFAIPCHECGSLFVPTRETLKFKPGKPETARLECTECAAPMDNRQRLKAIDEGVFVACNATPEPGIRSFHLTELVSKFSSLASVAKQVEDAKTEEERKVLTNTVFAETYSAHGDVELDLETLRGRAIKLVAPYSKSIEFVTAGVDVQGNRLEVLYLAHAKDGAKWVLDRQIIAGDTSSPEPWNVLSARLKQAVFRLEDGRNLPLSHTFIDSGFNAHRVYHFAATNPRVSAIKGVSGFDRPVIALGKRILAGSPLRLVLVGVDNAKLAAAKGLAKTEIGSGYIYLPAHLDSDFFEQLTAEKLETLTTNRGYGKLVWSKDREARNEAFDCLAYALAAGETVTKPAKPVNGKPEKTIGELAADLQNASNPKSTAPEDQPEKVVPFARASTPNRN